MSESLTLPHVPGTLSEFATQPPERVAPALEDAHPWLDASRWGAAYAQGIAEPGGPFCVVHPRAGRQRRPPQAR